MVIDIFLVKNYCENMRSTARGSAVSGGIMRVSFFKRTIFVLIVVLSVIMAFALAGCEDKDGCTHVWNDGEITTAATCTQDGVKTFTCTLCGETRTEVVGSSGHVASETFVNTDPEGHYHVCSVCGEKTDDVQAHAFEDGEVIKQPSATEDGLQKIVCSVCGYESTKVLSPETHTHVFDREVADAKYLVSEATCIAKAVYYKSCACGAKGTETFESGEVAGHVFDQEVADAKYLVSEATCIAKAVYYKSCACGEKGTETFEYGEYAAHTLVKTDREEPTCIENGTEAYYTCSHCDKIFADANANREIDAPVTTDALGHDTDGVNWTAEGDVHYKACRRCGVHIDEAAHSGGTASCEAKAACEICGNEYGDYADHVPVKTERVEPTCIENGTEAYWTCSECGKLFSDENGQNEISETVVIPATGHTYGDWKKDATGHWHECSVCGNKNDFAEHTPDKDAPTETEGVVCTVCGYEIQPATGHEHTPSEDWTYDETYHWHACGGCSQQLDKAAHEYNVQKVSDEYLASAATCMNKATYYYSCECGAKGTATFESGEVAGHVFDQEVADQKYLVSEATCTAKAVYYKSCVCGETGTETFEYGEFEHTLVTDHDADGHWQKCTVCLQKFNESAHEWDGGVVTTKPTLTSEGEKTYTCVCGETKVEKLPAQASFADDFTLEEGKPGPWSYGSIDYKWGEPEDFTFTQATSKNDGGDGWAAEGVEIKGGWINANNMMAVAYTVDSDVTVKVNLTFTGGTADTRLSLRTGVKNADGVIYGNPAYFDGGKQSNVLNYETTLELKAGDTVYFILGNENGANPDAYPNGGLDIVLTQVIG